MANKEELLNELTVAQLKELAEENDASDELQGLSTKSDIVEALGTSRSVSKSAIEEKVNGGGDDEDDDPPEVSAGGLPNNAGNTGGATAPTADESSEASASPPASTTGTPVSQLDTIQQVDESGSNVPAPNLRQPAAEGQIEATSGVNVRAESLDPALTDPDAAAVERVEGRTSDAANRDAGVTASEVPPDIGAAAKASDAGPEQYPFPPSGDVDVATVDPGNGEGEYYPNLEIEDWVVLDGSHELVPDRLDGRRAVVLDAPRYLVPMDRKDEVWITVRTRDEVNATLSIPLAAVKEVQKGGLATDRRS